MARITWAARMLATATVACLACGGDAATSSRVAVASVTIDPAAITVMLSEVAHLTATVRDAAGNTLAGRTVAWSSATPSVATVDANGLIHPVTAGSTTVTAASEGKTATASVTVVPAPGPSLTVVLGYSSVMPGQTTVALAVLRDAAGVVTPVTSIAWTSSDTALATVSSSGFVVALGEGTVSITATSQGVTGSAPLAVQALPPAPDVAVTEFSPAVYPATGGQGVALIVDARSTATAATLTLPGLGGTVSLRRLGTSTRFVAVLTAAQVAATCGNVSLGLSALTCVGGSISVANSAGSPTIIGNIGLPQLSPDAPPVTVTPISAALQRTAYAVNIRDDGLRQSGNRAAVMQRFYQSFPDAFEFVALSEIATTRSTPSFLAVRNRTGGTGSLIFDHGDVYGSTAAGTLIGFVNFGNSLDLAHQAASHEMAHAYCCYLGNTALSTTTLHWPLSSASFAIMGSNAVGSNAGNRMLTALGSGSYRVDARSPFGGFNELELYLMGLADSAEVATQFVFQNQNQSAEVGQVLQGPVTTVTMRDIVTANGLRTPAYTGTPVTFHLATIVVSRGRLLTAPEMAYFDRGAARGEATVSFDGMFLTPFVVNTRGRGILITRIP